MVRLLSVAQRVDEEREGRGRLAAARIVEMVAGEGRAPVAEHPHQPPVGEMRRHDILGHVGEAEAGERRFEAQVGALLNTSWPSTRTLSSRPSFSNSQA